MEKLARARYMLEFQREAVRKVESGQTIAAAARTLGIVEHTLFKRVKAQRQGTLSGAASKTVSADQMEISLLRAELARVKMERDILPPQRRRSVAGDLAWAFANSRSFASLRMTMHFN